MSENYIEREKIINTLNKSLELENINPRARDINWEVIRSCYVLGKRKQLSDNIWVSEDYSYQELATKFQLKLNTIKKKASAESWNKLRRAYLARVNNINIGSELGLYTRENYQSEISALNVSQKLGIILDRYLENRFGDVLNKADDVSLPENYQDEIFYEYEVDKFGKKTPVVELSELKTAVQIAQDIYTLQRKVYQNSPDTEKEIIEELANKPRFRSAQEREAKISQLSAKLQVNLKQMNQPEENFITVQVNQ